MSDSSSLANGIQKLLNITIYPMIKALKYYLNINIWLRLTILSRRFHIISMDAMDIIMIDVAVRSKEKGISLTKASKILPEK